MGMKVEYTRNPDLLVQMAASRRRAMVEAAAIILAAAEAGAPRENGEPKHGIHGADTGFVRLDAANERVAIGFEADWMVWQHENLEYAHEHGHAKFLELALLELGPKAMAYIAEHMVGE